MAEGGELADEVAGLAVGILLAGVPVASEVSVAAGGVVHQVPDGDQDGAGDGDQGFEVALAFDDAAVPGAEEGVGAGRGYGGLTERAPQPGISFPRGPGGVLRSGLEGPWGQPLSRFVRSDRHPGR